MKPDSRAPAKTPNYFCTWSTQNYLYGCGLDALDNAELEGARGAMHARESMTEAMIFGPSGWARRFYKEVRSELFFLLDDGWDVPPEVDGGYFGSLIVDERRFPSCSGSPEQRLLALNDLARNAGWRGIGLWVAAQEAPALVGDGALSGERQKAYWMERLTWSARAGIGYWKVDWGKHAHDPAFRSNLTQWGREVAPELIIEHAVCQGCYNDEEPEGLGQTAPGAPLRIHTGKADGRIVSRQAEMLRFSDVLRSYDVLAHLSQAQTIERVSRLLLESQSAPASGMGLINCEDEVYVAAALGLCAGVMRFPLHGLRPGADMDLFFPASDRQTKRRMDEVTRCIRFQRYMPAFGVDKAPVAVDSARLTDAWRFEAGQTWLSTAIGQVIPQSAPGRVSRGMDLPIVRAEGEAPFVLSARHPNGVMAVAALARTSLARSYYTPLAEVTLDLKGQTEALGVFGRYARLCLLGANAAGKRIHAQDLCGQKVLDVTEEAEILGEAVCIPGSLIDRVGRMEGSKGDVSDPGLLLTIR